MSHRIHRRTDSPGEIGHEAEGLAARYLSRHGLRLVTRNYRCRRGEIDLVMHDSDTLVFVEVRRRTCRTFGGGLESVDARKRMRLAAAAEHYLTMKHFGDERPCRFDVVAIDGPSPQVTIEWVRDAFET